MAEPMQNANEIRGVLDGGRLQFRAGGKWIDAGGDANTWLVLLVCAGMRDGAYRIKPAGVKACVATRSRCPDVGPDNTCSLPDGACDGQRTHGVGGLDHQTFPQQTPTGGQR